MSMKMPRLILLACVICPSLSWGLGLGEIHLHSALDEPMRADIDLVAATPNELSGVHASLAPVADFTRYGIQFPPFLSTFKFQVTTASSGRAVLRVTSTDAIPEPFVTFLVEVDWARGH
ncbi:MAG: pilus assembly protein FimV, partial [Gammaproteobacteria bacterium]|nr:pilus assembly protein FimV [Gammaproteobacteria bacterium]